MQPRPYATRGHHHTAADIDDFAETAQDDIGTILVDSTTIDFTYTDATPSITAAVIQSFAYHWTAQHTFDLGLLFKNQAIPSTPAAGYASMYALTNQGHTQLNMVDEDGSTLRMNRDNALIVRNTSGSDMVKGAVVTFNGSTGTVPTVTLADADVITLSATGVLAEAVANNGYGLMMVAGQVTGLDTHLLVEGALIYLSSTAGLYTTTAPTAPAFRQVLGIVLRSHLTQGTLEIGVTESAVFVQGANPSASIGLTAVNGSSQAFLRADGAPAIDVNIAPTWTNTHIWTDNDRVILGTGSDLNLYHDGTDSWIKNETGALIIQYNAGGSLQLYEEGAAALSMKFSTAAVQMPADNLALYLGAGDDLFLYHDGTNSLIRNATGKFIIKNDANAAMELYTNGTIRAAIYGNGRIDLGYGTTYYSIFNYDGVGANEDIYIRGGKVGSNVNIGDVNTSGAIIIGDSTRGYFYITSNGPQMKTPSGSPVVGVDATGLGIFGTTPVAKQTVTGSRGGNAALASLLTALANYGLITDSSS